MKNLTLTLIAILLTNNLFAQTEKRIAPEINYVHISTPLEIAANNANPMVDALQEPNSMFTNCMNAPKIQGIASKTLPLGDRDETVIVKRTRIHGNAAVSIEPDVVFIKGGIFTMGNSGSEARKDETPHTVTLDSFSIMKYELTIVQFKQFIDATGYQTDADKRTGNYGSHCWNGTGWEKKDGVNWKCDSNGKLRPTSEYKHPVIHVSWNDAMAYAKWLSQETGKTWRLPTEAEWEYAAKGGQDYTYSGSESIDSVAWYVGNSGNQDHPVGQKKPNRYGLYDMTGNV